VSLVAAARARPEGLANDVRRAIHEVNPNQAIFDVRTMRRVIDDSLADLRLYSLLVGLFAALALAIAVAGVYSVVAHGVAARTREFGIRLALGAGHGRILRLVLGHGFAVIAVGLGAGAWGAVAVVRSLRAVMGSVEWPAPAILGAIGTILAGAALTGCLVPARRATEVDPNVVLKYE
jgi:putative ABC transport system permease protein